MDDVLLKISQKIINLFDISIIIFEKKNNEFIYIYGNQFFQKNYPNKQIITNKTFKYMFPEYYKENILNKINSIINTSNTISFIEIDNKIDIYSIDNNYIVFCINVNYDKTLIDSNKTQILLNNMNHAIRTPLNSITGIINILLRSKITPEQYNYIEQIQQSCYLLVNVITDLLDFIKLETKNLTLSLSTFNIEDCINSCINIVKKKIDDKGLNLYIIIHPNVHKYVIGDMPRVKQIIMNILDNAIKFTDNGFIKIEVLENPLLNIKISDSGQGMTETEQKNLFGIIETIPNIHDQQIGLGLPITKYLVDLMEGSIDVISKKNSGSIFTISLPLKFFDIKEDNKEKSFNVLILNSNIRERIMISKLLVNNNIIPILTSSIDEAKIFISETNFDLIIIDKYKYISEFNNNDIKIILLSNTNDINISHNIQVIKSPYDLEDLKNLVVETLNISIENKNYSILNVEDIEINRIINEKILDTLGYHNYKSVINGNEAYDEIIKNNYDIVLLDIKLPHKNGFEILDELNSNSIKIPYIIVMTAYVSDQLENECKLRNIDDLLYKPIEMDKLQISLKKAQKILQHKKSD